jgi:hypothetical protein
MAGTPFTLSGQLLLWIRAPQIGTSDGSTTVDVRNHGSQCQEDAQVAASMKVSRSFVTRMSQ